VNPGVKAPPEHFDPGRDGHESRLARRWEDWGKGVPSILFLVVSALLMLGVLVGLGFLLTDVLSHGIVGDFDRGLSRWLAKERSEPLNETTNILTYLAETPTVVIIGLVTLVLARVVWKRWRESLFVLAALLGEVTIFLATTLLVERNRPGVPHLDIAPPTSSFPSGHTAAAIVLYGALWLIASARFNMTALHKLALALVVAVPVVVAVSRLYRGMHFFTDVLAGAFLGGVWLIVSLKAVRIGVTHQALKRPASPPEDPADRRDALSA
jgi:membrane-associated phospholipid phosphatase